LLVVVPVGNPRIYEQPRSRGVFLRHFVGSGLGELNSISRVVFWGSRLSDLS
jgi:hypothetical protein